MGPRTPGVGIVSPGTDRTSFPNITTHAQAELFMRVRGTVAVNLERPMFLLMARVARVDPVMRVPGTVGFGRRVGPNGKPAIMTK